MDRQSFGKGKLRWCFDSAVAERGLPEQRYGEPSGEDAGIHRSALKQSELALLGAVRKQL